MYINCVNNFTKRIWEGILIALIVCTGSAAAQCVVPPSDIAAWWAFDESSGSEARDLVGNRNGVYSNLPIQSIGLVGNALRFDGNDYVAVADDDLWNLSDRDFTIEFWANFDQGGGGSIGHPGDIFIGNDEGPGVRNKWFFALGGGYLNFHINGSTGGRFFPLAPFAPVVGQWYHLSITRDGDLYTIYVDGEIRGSETDTRVIPDANAPLTIGQAEFLGYMNGRLDEMTFYTRALSQAEILAIVDAADDGKCSELAIHPTEGGNDGDVTVNLMGSGFQDGAIVLLTSVSNPDLEAFTTSMSQGGTQLSATFGFDEAPVGIRDVEVINPDGSVITGQNMFTITDENNVDIWIEDVGSQLIRPGRPQNHWIQVGNSGTVDSSFTYVLMELPNNMAYETDLLPGLPLDYDVGPPRSAQRFSIGVPPIAAGSYVSIPITYTTNELSNFSIQARAVQTSNIADPISLPLYDVINYPIEWDWRENPIVPAGYGVFYDDFNREGSVAITVGNGKVGHYVPSPDTSVSQNGLLRHPISFHSNEDGRLIEPIAVIRLNGFTLQKSNELRDHFNNPDHNIGYHVKTVNGEIQSFYDNELTEYNNKWWEKDFIKFPKGDCTSFLYKAWPDLQHLHKFNVLEYIFELGFPQSNAELLERLRYHYREKENLEYDKPKPIWADWFPDSLYLDFDYFKEILGIGSFDPNDKLGSIGVGPERFINGQTPLRYSVFFENKESATAAAQEVLVIDQIDLTKVDADSFALGPISFGERLVIPPPNAKHFSIDVDIRPEQDLLVRIQADFDTSTGLAQWRFTSIDPATGEITNDPIAGFLPPNVTPPEGDGAVLFTVMARQNLATGEEIRNDAEIYFDFNEVILTPEWINTIDITKPESQVLPLTATQSELDIDLQWTGTDVDAGIKDYTIYVSENGGPFGAWLLNTPDEAAIYTGTKNSTYSFYSVARDSLGNVEDAPVLGDATITILSNQAPVADAGPDTDVECLAPLSTLVFLDGSGSYDLDDDALTYTWTGSFPEGNGVVNGINPSVSLPLGETTISLVTNDGQENSIADEVVVTVVVRPEGFERPIGIMVPEADPLVLPDKAFKQARTLPLKFQIYCGTTPLTDVDVAAPKIAGISRIGDDTAVDLETIDIDAGKSADNGVSFRYEDGRWVYNLNTKGLLSGSYAITIELPDGRRFRTAIVLK